MKIVAQMSKKKSFYRFFTKYDLIFLKNILSEK